MKLIDYEKLVLEDLYDDDVYEEYLERNIISVEESCLGHEIIEEDIVEHLEISTLEYLEEISQIEFCSDEEFAKLLNNGEIESRDQVINRSLRIPVYIGMNMLKEGVDFLDLIQEGNIALILSAAKFSSSGYKSFTDYAKASIIRRMIVFINEKLQENKAEFIKYFEGLIEEYEEREDVIEELTNKMINIEKMDYLMLKNRMSELEISVVEKYYGFKDGKRQSMYEIEKFFNFEKGQGELIFQKSIDKLSKFGGVFFKI